MRSLDQVTEGLVALFGQGEMAGLSVAIVREGELAYSGAWGRRYISPDSSRPDLPVLPETRFRLASMSKPFTALGVLKLACEGRLDLEADVSAYLGFPLRNPAWPQRAITATMLLSHTSSLRDGLAYSLPPGHALRECFEPGTSFYEEGAHFARPGAEGPAGAELEPGGFLRYCNLGYGVLGTIIEAVTGRSFDLYMRDEVLVPLGIAGSYNVSLLSDEGLAGLGVLYRGPWIDGAGQAGGLGLPPGGQAPFWRAQIDDLGGKRPARAGVAGVTGAPGTNGTLFGPQGGLRASVLELATLGRLIIGGGRLGGKRLFPAAAIDAMCETVWTWAEGGARGGDAFIPAEVGRGLMRFGTGARPGDFLVPGRARPMWGHSGDAWGLRGGFLVDRAGAGAIAYIISGTARDPDLSPGRFSPVSIWEEEARAILVEALG
jgi:CubicO group peptidase (beta-lactamase class C family)